MPLNDLDRRVLAHLPPYFPPEREKEVIAAEVAESGVSIRGYNLPDFTARLSEDPDSQGRDRAGNVRHPFEDEVALLLEGLVARGFAERVEAADWHGGPAWRMTEAGWDALHEPANAPSALPGAAEVNLHPARTRSDAL